jgi:hypothetical protein
MEGESQGLVRREFSFAIVIPKATPGMSKGQRAAIENAAAVFTGRKGKLKWETILEIGLPILFSFIP